MSSFGYKAKFGGPGQVVRFIPESRHRRAPILPVFTPMPANGTFEDRQTKPL